MGYTEMTSTDTICFCANENIWT